MRRLLFAALVSISAPMAASAEFDKARCAALIPRTSELADVAGESSTIFAQSEATLVTDTTGSLNEAGRRAETARAKLLAAMREYRAAMEEMTYQLRLCAR